MRNNMPVKFDFTNTCMFNRVMRNQSICRALLESILGIPVDKIEYHNTEQELNPFLDTRGIRVDVFVKAEGKIFDVEMQAYADKDLPRRARYYQSIIDAACLEKGQYFRNLPESFIIFICKHDVLGGGAPRYDIEAQCVNHPETTYSNGAHVIVLNASAWKDAGQDDPDGLLEYVSTGNNGGSPLVTEIDQAVCEANQDRKWVDQAMGFLTLEDYYENVIASQAAENNELALAYQQLKENGATAAKELEAAREQNTATIRELEAAREQSEAAARELEAAREQNTATIRELEAAREQSEAAARELEATEARNAQNAALAKALHEKGRGEEYFAALDDAKLMSQLMEEFGLV